jgi:beta-N-acetylhexosaminidase
MARWSALNREEQVGQLLWIGFEGSSWSTRLRKLVDRVRPGGLILFGRNIESARQVRSLTDALSRAVRIPPFIAIDQEGGRVNRLRGILGETPSAFWLAARPDPRTAVRIHAAATAGALRSLGLNVNFAPVLDLSGADQRNGIGDRSLGEDPRRVSDLAGIVLREHLRAGIVPVGKHFPGLGSARADTHLALPVIRRTRRQLLTHDVLPYRRLRKILPIVMVGHAFYPALQGTTPRAATLSTLIVQSLLKRRTGHRGLVLTDDLEMGAIDQKLDGGEQAVAAFESGSDGLMFCRSEERILEARAGLLRAVDSGTMSAARLGGSMRRILRLKERHLARRRAVFSTGRLARARLLIESLGGPAPAGVDPTARP